MKTRKFVRRKKAIDTTQSSCGEQGAYNPFTNITFHFDDNYGVTPAQNEAAAKVLFANHGRTEKKATNPWPAFFVFCVILALLVWWLA